MPSVVERAPDLVSKDTVALILMLGSRIADT